MLFSFIVILEFTKMPRQSNSKVLSLIRRASESTDNNYTENHEAVLSKTTKSNFLKDTLFASNKELKEKVKALESQNQSLKEINNLLKEKIERAYKSCSAVPTDPSSISLSPKKQKTLNICSHCQLYGP